MGYSLQQDVGVSDAPSKTHTRVPRSSSPGLRFYSAGVGRWLSRDPLWESGGINLTLSCYNDLVNHVDDNGSKPLPETTRIIQRSTPPPPRAVPGTMPDGIVSLQTRLNEAPLNNTLPTASSAAQAIGSVLSFGATVADFGIMQLAARSICSSIHPKGGGCRCCWWEFFEQTDPSSLQTSYIFQYAFLYDMPCDSVPGYLASMTAIREAAGPGQTRRHSALAW
jgi:RHS repeat-associated protein